MHRYVPVPVPHRTPTLQTSQSRAAQRPTVLLVLALVAGGCDESVEVGPILDGGGSISVIDSGGPEGDTGWWPSIVFGRGLTG